MGFINWFWDMVMHLDKHLLTIVSTYGNWTYGILFTIIFLETALVLTPFLPGDSLLFTAGAIAAQGSLNVYILFALLSVASILGDSLNYGIGHYIGPKVFKYKGKLLNKQQLIRSHKFFDKYGAKTIVLARFIPIVRTFAPFLAGVGRMNYFKFLAYNVVGGILWVGIFVWAGYFFGNMTFVKDNFTLFIIGIIIVSFIPVFTEYYKHRREMRLAKEMKKSRFKNKKRLQRR